jgi:hypothetical protein
MNMSMNGFRPITGSMQPSPQSVDHHGGGGGVFSNHIGFQQPKPQPQPPHLEYHFQQVWSAFDGSKSLQSLKQPEQVASPAPLLREYVSQSESSTLDDFSLSVPPPPLPLPPLHFK